MLCTKYHYWIQSWGLFYFIHYLQSFCSKLRSNLGILCSSAWFTHSSFNTHNLLLVWKYDSLLKHTVHKVNLQEDLFCPAGIMHFSFQRELIALIHFLTNFSVLILKGLNNFYKVSIIKKVTIEHTLKKIILKLLEPTWTFLDCY